MQKLVTVYLDTMAYMGEKWLAASHADKHGSVQEHLQPYLQDGWRIVSLTALGGANDSMNARGWIAVVLEK